MPKSKSTPPRETKTADLCRLLSRRAGADLADLQSATGWQPHSVGAALSGLRKAGYAIDRAELANPGAGAIDHIIGESERT